MSYALYEIMNTNIGNQRGQILRKLPTIEWTKYKDHQKDDDGWVHNSFENKEEMIKKIQPLLDKENNDDFLLSGISKYDKFVLLEEITFK